MSTQSTTTCWGAAPRDLQLRGDEVHVWRVPLNASSATRICLEGLLSAQEKERARKFRFEIPRGEFVIARGSLRVILGSYLKMHPGQLRFSYGPQGKPEIAAFAEPVDLRFNISHSHGLALIAVTRGRQIGVDLEFIHGELDSEAIAAGVFSAAEIQALNGLPPIKRLRAFYQLWTCKEAYIKATGDGFSEEPSRFEVTSVSNAVFHVPNGSKETSHWIIRELDMEEGYAAAVAAEGADWKFACWEWNALLPDRASSQ